MENNTELVRLEQFVDKLLAKYKKLQEKYNNLEDTLEERDAECARLQQQLEELRSERTQVGQKVAGLIDRIERWELEEDEEEVDIPEAMPEEVSEGVQGKLFLGKASMVDQES